jgi:hypothetical protein
LFSFLAYYFVPISTTTQRWIRRKKSNQGCHSFVAQIVVSLTAVELSTFENNKFNKLATATARGKNSLVLLFPLMLCLL